MLLISPHQQVYTPSNDVLALGVGGAGTHIMEKLFQESSLEGLRTVTVNSDARLVQRAVVGKSLSLGVSLTRGMSCGGDALLGLKAAELENGLWQSLFEGVTLVLLTGGLGGGTASGALPYMAQKAKEAGAFVIAYVSLPFSFEGVRRDVQARRALAELRHHVHLVIPFENDHLGEYIDEEQGVLTAFSAADNFMAQTMLTTARMVLSAGLIHVGLDDLAAAAGQGNSPCLVGYGRAKEQNNCQQAMEALFDSPMLKRLGDTKGNILLYVHVNPMVSWREIEAMLTQVTKRFSAESRVFVGISTSDDAKNGVEFFVLASSVDDAEISSAPAKLSVMPAREFIIDPTLGQEKVLAETSAEEISPAFDGGDVAEEIGTVELPQEVAFLDESLEELYASSSPIIPMDAEAKAPSIAVKVKPVQEGEYVAAAPFVRTRKPKIVAELEYKEEEEKIVLPPIIDKGRFSGDFPNVFEGEDLDLPPALRRQ